MLRSIALWGICAPLFAWCQPPPGYYDAAEGLSGEALRAALHEIIDDHQVLPNSQLWNAFGLADRKPDGTVWDIYSDVPDGTPAYVFEFVVDQCGNYSGEGDCFNREHSFPQSWFGSAAPMNTDMFHIYPTDAWVNQQRANWPFGKVNTPTWTSSNGSKLGPCAWPGCSGTVFEPIDAYKGDLARSYFYLLTRYMDVASGWTAPVVQNGDLFGWAEELLLAWHVADPVSQKEIDRNNTIYAQLQGNRNPFIDRPEWAHAIWGAFASVEEQEAPKPRVWATDGVLHVMLDGAPVDHELVVLDALGRAVRTEHLVQQHTSLPWQGASGVHIAVITSRQGRSAVHFVQP
jgi:endonuclease I